LHYNPRYGAGNLPPLWEESVILCGFEVGCSRAAARIEAASVVGDALVASLRDAKMLTEVSRGGEQARARRRKGDELVCPARHRRRHHESEMWFISNRAKFHGERKGLWILSITGRNDRRIAIVQQHAMCSRHAGSDDAMRAVVSRELCQRTSAAGRTAVFSRACIRGLGSSIGTRWR
jgi:hypothetical protein